MSKALLPAHRKFAIEQAKLRRLGNPREVGTVTEDPDPDSIVLAKTRSCVKATVFSKTLPQSLKSSPILERIDYTLLVLGHEVSTDSPTVEWDCGAITALPFISDPEHPGANLLLRDNEFSQNLAQQRDGRKSSFVRYYDYNETLKKEVVESTCRALICGQAFVVKHCTDRPSHHSQAKLSAELLRDMLGYGADGRMFEIHDALRRIGDPELPQASGNLAQFLENIAAHDKIQCILDMPAGDGYVPLTARSLDQGFMAFQEVRDLYQQHLVLQDVYDVRSWFLLHMGPYLTYPHHDAGGFGTYLRVLTGGKMLAVYRPGGYAEVQNRAELDHQHEKFEDKEGDPGEQNGFGIEWDDNCEAAIIHIEPGDLVFMPPGMFHAALTPMSCVAQGGHVLLYNALHLTEAARACDHRKAKFLTNTDHICIDKILARMVIALIRLKDLVLYRKPVIALCLMVGNPSRYQPNTSNPDHTKRFKAIQRDQETRDSKRVVDVLTEKLGLLKYFDDDGPDYLFEGMSWMDPGPVIDVASALSGFSTSDPFPRRRRMETTKRKEKIN